MAEIVGVHGVKGMVKLKVFSDDWQKLADYAPLCDAAGNRTFRFLSLQPHGNVCLAALEGVVDRTAAEKLRGTKLCVPRSALPALEDGHSYYHADLVGLAAKDAAGAPIGKIVQVANFGAGDLLEIKPPKGASYYVPFTHDVVPRVDIKAGEATIIVPHGLLD